MGNINPATPGSLIIHKHVDGSQNKPGTPDGKTEVTAEGVQGVVFTTYKLTNIDLTKQADWEKIPTSIPADACGTTPSLKLKDGATDATFDAGTASPKTDDEGDATIKNLAVAAYLVCETSAPSNIVQKAAPFLVTIPFPNNEANAATSNDGEWLYNVNVYPKNKKVDKPTKDLLVSNNGLVNEGQLTYTVSQVVPKIADDHSFSEFIIGDKMSAGQDATKETVKSVKVGDTDLAGKYTVTEKDGKLYVSLTKEGLAALKTNQGKTVVVTFTTKANQIGQLENTAESYIKSIPGDTPPSTPAPTPGDEEPQPTNKVVSSWGDVIIAKQDPETADKKKLAGATFEVYNAKAAYDGTCTKEIDGAALTVNGKTSFTTDATGTVKIDSLFVDQGKAEQKIGADGKPVFEADGKTPVYGEIEWKSGNGNKHRCYVLKETAAPAGYTLPTGDKSLFPVKVTPGATTAAQDIVVDNTKQNVPGLPLTGANGQLLLTIGGTFVARRRREQD